MFGRLKKLVSATLIDQAAATPHSHDEKLLASAVLLVEAASRDGVISDDEEATITTLMERHFGLSGDEASALIEDARQTQSEANELVRFTRAVKSAFGPEERIHIIEMLWEVAYADGELHHYEAALLRKVGGLIYVSDRDRGAARKRVLTRLGITGAPT
jgi:uncharacterized tellurite resistance protein B-like protein